MHRDSKIKRTQKKYFMAPQITLRISGAMKWKFPAQQSVYSRALLK